MTETPPNIIPVVRYRDANAAIDWLGRAFGFEEKAIHRREDGAIQHAELRLGAGLIMIGQYAGDGWMGSGRPEPLASPLSVYVVVEDADAHHDRAKQAGVMVVRELTDQDYGSREYSARDLEHNLWSFGTYDPYAGA